MGREIYDEIGLTLTSELGIVMGQMFGAPCMKTGKKAFAVFYKGDMAFKLEQQEVKLLVEKYPGAKNWDPSGKGKAMREWLHVPSDFKEDWETLARQARAFVAGSAG